MTQVLNPPPTRVPGKLTSAIQRATGGDAESAGFFSRLVQSVYLIFARLDRFSTNITSGEGSPENAVLGSVGDLFLRTDGGASTTLYVKESGTDTDTGWVAK